ncbi:MAG: DUF1311 domain-containing protein [Hyphomicrobiaceae bacterium]|nr:DUF1311 domain-containing protein [Hyphomicrobiaceae bacterium]MCC0007960.1 DUF1311 domain-containing protein [Hyphomicrobiaceae bacterium]
MTMPLRSITAAIVVAAAVSALTSPASAASFSCMGYEDLNDAEQTVCSNQRIGALDERLDSWYRRALVRAGYFEQTEWLRAEQREWLQDRNACGAHVGCLNRIYRTRIRALRNYVEHV